MYGRLVHRPERGRSDLALRWCRVIFVTLATCYEISSAGLGFRTSVKYVVRGKVFSSANSEYSSGDDLPRRTWLVGSVTSPNTMACVGQTALQALSTSPSRMGRPPASASISA